MWLMFARWASMAKGYILAGLSFVLVSISTKVATKASILAVIVAFFLGVMATLTGVINGIASVAPDSFNVAYSWIIPDNFVPCITAIFTVQVAVWVWRWKKFAIDFVSEGVN